MSCRVGLVVGGQKFRTQLRPGAKKCDTRRRYSDASLTADLGPRPLSTTYDTKQPECVKMSRDWDCAFILATGRKNTVFAEPRSKR